MDLVPPGWGDGGSSSALPAAPCPVDPQPLPRTSSLPTGPTVLACPPLSAPGSFQALGECLQSVSPKGCILWEEGDPETRILWEEGDPWHDQR